MAWVREFVCKRLPHARWKHHRLTGAAWKPGYLSYTHTLFAQARPSLDAQEPIVAAARGPTARNSPTLKIDPAAHLRSDIHQAATVRCYCPLARVISSSVQFHADSKKTQSAG
ncbi:hypothetical protein CDD83_1558 [Cordyceps sp. RAO-2017]|nr:hypothetical protein CDD83_1558 [Cordyceps sp. RAO-2017]